jgi:hypothetical protein
MAVGGEKVWGAAVSTKEKIWESLGGGNSTVESHSSKVMVAGSNPVPRSRIWHVSWCEEIWQQSEVKRYCK